MSETGGNDLEMESSKGRTLHKGDGFTQNSPFLFDVILKKRKQYLYAEEAVQKCMA